MDTYLEIAEDFSTEYMLKVAKKLEETMQYSRAINLYKRACKHQMSHHNQDCYAGFGYCYYKLGQYREAAVWFSNLIKENPDNQKAIQFKQWSEDRY